MWAVTYMEHCVSIKSYQNTAGVLGGERGLKHIIVTGVVAGLARPFHVRSIGFQLRFSFVVFQSSFASKTNFRTSSSTCHTLTRTHTHSHIESVRVKCRFVRAAWRAGNFALGHSLFMGRPEMAANMLPNANTECPMPACLRVCVFSCFSLCACVFVQHKCNLYNWLWLLPPLGSA